MVFLSGATSTSIRAPWRSIQRRRASIAATYASSSAAEILDAAMLLKRVVTSIEQPTVTTDQHVTCCRGAQQLAHSRIEADELRAETEVALDPTIERVEGRRDIAEAEPRCSRNLEVGGLNQGKELTQHRRAQGTGKSQGGDELPATLPRLAHARTRSRCLLGAAGVWHRAQNRK